MADAATIKVTCPACGHRLKVPPKYAGKKVRCPGCEAGVSVPADGATGGTGKPKAARPAAPAEFPPFPTPLASRAYVHDRCGGTTEVDGGHFKATASPVPGMTRMMCVECGGMFPVGEFRWEDTGEPLPSYYARYAGRVSPAVAWACGSAAGKVAVALGAAAGVGLGVAVGFAAGAVWGVVAGAVAAAVGMAAGLGIWAQASDVVLRSRLGVPDVRCLR